MMRSCPSVELELLYSDSIDCVVPTKLVSILYEIKLRYCQLQLQLKQACSYALVCSRLTLTQRNRKRADIQVVLQNVELLPEEQEKRRIVRTQGLKQDNLNLQIQDLNSASNKLWQIYLVVLGQIQGREPPGKIQENSLAFHIHEDYAVCRHLNALSNS